jgi:UDP-N-acetylmuramate--alanine ligase
MMIMIENIKRVYFIGIGGIGMSALARYFKEKAVEVSGYDKTRTKLTEELEQGGIEIHYEERTDLIPKEVDLVVYTPAIPKDHRELLFYRQNNYPLVKRSDVLQAITRSSFNICVAGTHGKTTISTMIGHLLRHSEYGCNAFLGGIAVNYNSNYWSQAPAAGSKNNVVVVEADEYDRSFLKLDPDIAVISAMDADHLDIYGTAEEMEKAFIEFAGRIKNDGVLFSKFGLNRTKDLNAPHHLTYSLQHQQADIYAGNIKMMHGSYEFDVMTKDRVTDKVQLNIGGMHNVENAVVAIAVAQRLGISDEKIRAAVSSFKGVKRRFEYIVKNDRHVFIDDYAHHPEELRALISSAKSLFGGKKCVIAFQPHLYTRTRDLADGFAGVLGLADEVILLPIYPARELPLAGVNSEMILENIKNPDKRVLNKEELLNWVKEQQPSLFITAGAGDIDMLVEPIGKLLK